MAQVVDAVVEQVAPADSRTTDPVRWSRSVRTALAWCLTASALLVASGVVRAVQSRQDEVGRNARAECPFPLKELPRTVGVWHVVDGSETTLDPLTTRLTGSTDHILWTYADDLTGTLLSVLVLYGPAEPVLPHTPQICYPSSGFQPVGDTIDRTIKIEDHPDATFRSSVFAKSAGRSMNSNAVYHAFYLNGPWTPAIGNRKVLRENPGIFKIQIQRRVVDGEKRDTDEPIEDFIRKMVPAIEAKIAQSSRPPATPTAVTAR